MREKGGEEGSPSAPASIATGPSAAGLPRREEGSQHGPSPSQKGLRCAVPVCRLAEKMFSSPRSRVRAGVPFLFASGAARWLCRSIDSGLLSVLPLRCCRDRERPTGGENDERFYASEADWPIECLTKRARACVRTEETWDRPGLRRGQAQCQNWFILPRHTWGLQCRIQVV